MTPESVVLAIGLGMALLCLAYVVKVLREVTIIASSRTTTEAANYRRVQKAPKKRVDDDLAELELLDPTTRGV